MKEFTTPRERHLIERDEKIVARFLELREAQPMASRNRIISSIVADPQYEIFSNVGCVKILKRAGVYEKE